MLLNHLKKTLLSLISVFALSNCATLPETPYSEFEAKNKSLKVEHKRVTGEVTADCNEGSCTIPESNLQALVDIITTLNNAGESLARANNKVVDALTKTEYALMQTEIAKEGYKNEAWLEKFFGMAKVGITLTACGLIFNK